MSPLLWWTRCAVPAKHAVLPLFGPPAPLNVTRGSTKVPATLTRTCVHACPCPAVPAAQVEAACEEALAAGGWCDVLPHVPSILSLSDTAALLAKCKAVAGAVAATGGPAHVMAGTCVVASAMLESIKQQLLEAARQAADEAHKQRKAGSSGGGGGAAPGGGKVAVTVLPSGKKAATAPAADSGSDDDWDTGGKKGKKGGARGKKAAKGGAGGGGDGSKQAKGSGGKTGGGQAAGSAGAAAASSSALSAASLARRVLSMHPDTEGAGAEGDLPLAIATGGWALGRVGRSVDCLSPWGLRGCSHACSYPALPRL